MNPKPHDEASIFASAVEIDSPSEREAYLKNACGENPNLHDRLQALLKSHDEESQFLKPPVRPAETELRRIESPGTVIGPYKLLQKIGEGGFGVVYMAEQKQPIRRKVALKIIKLGMDTRQVIARFEAERQALAMMDHPNIAKVLDAGSTDTGRPYFVMELVRGDPITEYCDSQRVDTNERLRLFADVCHAVQHAHQKGIIHRDIKPSNVMVTMHDGRPVPKVIDFGIAKATQHELTEKTLFTEYRQLIGTPAYMSPEQAEMSGLGVDTRSDIYSLGVLLYELLTSTTPFAASQFRRAAFDEIVRMIRDTEPPKPSMRLHTLSSSATNTDGKTDAGKGSTADADRQDDASSVQDIARMRHTDPESLTKSLRGDLDWIVMKALEKDRGRRYETAKDLAVDVGRHLNNEPVWASPPSATYRLRKYVRRNRSLVVAASLVMACLLIGLIVSSAGFIQAAHQRNRAITAEQRAVAARDERARERDAAQWERDRAVNAEAVAERQREEAEAVVGLLAEMIGSASPEDLKGPNYTVRQLLDDFSAKLEGRLKDRPAVEATVRLMISDVYQQFRLNDQGLVHAKRAYELRRELYGDAHELTIRAERSKGLHMIFAASDDPREGRDILRKIIERHPPFMDVDHEFTIRTKNGVLLFTGSDDKSLHGFRELLAEAESKLGSDNLITAIVRGNYASRLMAADQLEEAERQARQAVETREALGGSENPIASLYRVRHARVLDAKGDHESAKAILLKELAFQRKQLGESHRDTLATLGSLLRILYKHDESQVADDLLSECVEGLQSDEGSGPLTVVNRIVRVASGSKIRSTPVAGKLLEEAAQIYIDGHGDTDEHAALAEQDVGVRLAIALERNQRFDLAEQVTPVAEQVARVAWNASGSENANHDLASNLIRAMLANGNLEGVAHFVQQELPPESESFRQFDRNSDGQLTSSEIPAFFSPRRFGQMDKDTDRTITPDETGEALWRIIVGVDQNEDGSIERGEYRRALLVVAFLRLDRNGDGQLTDNELPESYPVSRARLDINGDGSVSETEFIEMTQGTFEGRGTFGPFTPPSMRSERFRHNDRDADGRVSRDEADEDFWRAIAEFDKNEDNAVDLAEYEQGLKTLAHERTERFFSRWDKDSDGQASRDEVPAFFQERWSSLDANGDDMLDKDEFMKAWLPGSSQNDER